MITATESDLTYTTSDYRGVETVHRILVIEYHDNRPFTVVTDHGSFDFEYCRRDDSLEYLDTGSGLHGDTPSYGICGFCKPVPPPGKIWTAPGVGLHVWKSAREQRVPVDGAALLAMGYVRLRKPLLLKYWSGTTRNPFEAAEPGDCHTQYCSICDDHLPENDLCRHVYLTECGECVGAGSEEPRQEFVFAALDWLALMNGWRDWWRIWGFARSLNKPSAVHMIESILLSGNFSGVHACHNIESFFADNHDGHDCEERFGECEDGLGWLTTLGPDTPAANALTLRWIMEWRLSAGERAKAAERKRLVKELGQVAYASGKVAEILAALGIPGGKRADLDTVPVDRIRAVLDALKAQVPA